MALMDPIETLIDSFNMGPLNRVRMGPRTQNQYGGSEPGAVVTTPVDPIAAHEVTGRDLENVPEAVRNSEVVEFYARDGSFTGTPGWAVADDGVTSDRQEYNGRTYKIVKVRSYQTQGRVWIAYGALQDGQAVA